MWYLDELGLPAATVDYESARIGDGVDTARNGSISHINETAGECGCAVGQHALRCARIMHDERIEPPEAAAGNETTCTTVSGGSVPVWTIDSIGSITDEHEGTITVTGSHGERLAGEFRSYIPTDVAGITLFDAGVGKDDAGIGRLRSMDERDIPTAAVGVDRGDRNELRGLTADTPKAATLASARHAIASCVGLASPPARRGGSSGS